MPATPSQPVTASLAKAKATMDAYLQKVPQPTQWGIEGIAAHGVTPARHRQAYYAAWAFLIQDTMNPFPENPAYPYPQICSGKPSLWDGGEHTSAATCGWESFLGLHGSPCWNRSFAGRPTKGSCRGWMKRGNWAANRSPHARRKRPGSSINENPTGPGWRPFTRPSPATCGGAKESPLDH